MGGKEGHFQCVDRVDPEIAHELEASGVLKSLTIFGRVGMRWGICGASSNF